MLKGFVLFRFAAYAVGRRRPPLSGTVVFNLRVADHFWRIEQIFYVYTAVLLLLYSNFRRGSSAYSGLL